MPQFLLAGDYTFAFNYKIPDTVMNQWPASFHMKRHAPDKGEVKFHTKYHIKVMLMKIGSEIITKNKRRFFLAKKPFNPR